MKKTLAALAVLSAFAGSAIAADVTLYGRVDLGLRYTNVDADVQGEDDVSQFEMASGNYTAPATASASRARKNSATA